MSIGGASRSTPSVRKGSQKNRLRVCEYRGKKPQVPPLRSPGFPVENRGFDQHHAVFLKKTAYVVAADLLEATSKLISSPVSERVRHIRTPLRICRQTRADRRRCPHYR